MSYSSDSFLDEIVLDVAARYPDRIALEYAQEALTYAQFAKRIAALSKALILNNILPGDFVASLLTPGLDITVALLAIHKVGAIYTPLDPEHPAGQIRERLEAVSAKLILVDGSTRNAASQLDTPYLEVSALLHQGAVSRQTLDFPERSLDAPACIFFTSGTTGTAKGVLGSFRAQRNSILEPTIHLGIGPSDTINSMARYAWSISMLELLAPLVVGGTSIILDRSAALNFDELREKLQKCSAFHCPPALLKSFSLYLGNHFHNDTDLSHIRLVWYGGDKLSIESIECVQRAFPNAVVSTAYGATEIFGLSHCYFYSRETPPEHVLVGKPVGNLKHKLFDNEVEVTNQPKTLGEIFLGGDRVALEYWREPELTAASFKEIDGERFYRTGDFGRLDESGNLEFVERKDSQVKVRGIRIELQEVEHLIQKNLRVSEAVVIATEIGGESKTLSAFVVLTKENKGKIYELRRELKQDMPDYLLPGHLIEVSGLPMTENFKIDRKALAQIQLAEKPVERSEITDTAALRLARIWEKAAGIFPQKITDNFFDIGGNSLSAAILAASLGREFASPVEVADIYRNPTLSAQQQKLIQASNSAPIDTTLATETLAAEGQKGLLFRELFENSGSSITCTRYIESTSGFDEGLLRKALLKLIDRFPTLRTNLKFEKGKILLVENPGLDPESIKIKKIAGIWTINAEPGKQRLVKQACNFDLRNDTLISAMISTLDNGNEVLQLTAHHVAADDNSMGRLAKDCLLIYDALRRGIEPVLQDVRTTYKDFVVDQHRNLDAGIFKSAAGELATRLLAHYERYNEEPIIRFDQNSLKAQNRPGTLEVPAEVERQRFVDYLAALSWAMYQTFGREDFVFCAHVALRRDSDTEPQVGMFVNLLPVFIKLNPEDSVEAHGKSVQDCFSEAMTRSNVPYELILTQNQKLRHLKGFPFDAFINELDFTDEYPAGYSPVVVSRNLSTDSREISMSVLHLHDREYLKFEYPEFEGSSSVIPELATKMKAFLEATNCH